MKALLLTAWRLSPRRVTAQVALLLFTGLLGGVSLLLLVPIVDAAAGESNAWLRLLPEGLPLGLLLVAFVVLVALQALIARTSAINSIRVQQGLVDSLRQEAFDAVLHARWTYLLSKQRSDILTTTSVGAGRAGMAYMQLLQAAISAVLALAAAVVAVVVSPVVGGLAIVAVAIMGAVQATAIRPARRLGELLGERHRTAQGVMHDSLDSVRLVRAHDASAIWTHRLASAFTGAREVQEATARRTSTISGATSVATAAAAALLVWIAVQLAVAPAMIVVLLIVVARLAGSVRQTVTTATGAANSLPAVDDLLDLIREARSHAEVQAGQESTRAPLRAESDHPLLEFTDVSFSYPGTSNGVTNLSLRIHRGEIVALTGPSGAGKSTTVDLALGLLAPDSGMIAVDDEELTTADLSWWRRHVAYVPQETLILPGTLRDNLVWSAAVPVTEDECWTALSQASAHFTQDLPEGLDTPLGDGGLRLSGGERQRVALARALLRGPTLLVLDEPTSALDDATEIEVMEALRSLGPGTAVLIVSHRETTIAAADRRIELQHEAHVRTERALPGVLGRNP